MAKIKDFSAYLTSISVERLTELGYPKELVDTKYLPDFAVRGLIFDKKQGNFLKLDLHGLVITACRGICLSYCCHALRTISLLL